MKRSRRAKLELMEGRSFILGREGHIYIDSPTASKHHAELRIKDGKIYLRDLKSTNGTFLIKDKAPVEFDEGYVSPAQSIVIGKKVYVIEDLLAIASDFVGVDDNTTHFDLSAKSENAAAPDPELPKETG